MRTVLLFRWFCIKYRHVKRLVDFVIFSGDQEEDRLGWFCFKIFDKKIGLARKVSLVQTITQANRRTNKQENKQTNLKDVIF